MPNFSNWKYKMNHSYIIFKYCMPTELCLSFNSFLILFSFADKARTSVWNQMGHANSDAFYVYLLRFILLSLLKSTSPWVDTCSLCTADLYRSQWTRQSWITLVFCANIYFTWQSNSAIPVMWQYDIVCLSFSREAIKNFTHSTLYWAVLKFVLQYSYFQVSLGLCTVSCHHKTAWRIYIPNITAADNNQAYQKK